MSVKVYFTSNIEYEKLYSAVGYQEKIVLRFVDFNSLLDNLTKIKLVIWLFQCIELKKINIWLK